MSSLHRWASRLRGLFGKRRLDERLDEELRFHLDMQARDNQARGMSPEAARRAARLSFAAGGSVEPLKERYREQRGVPALEILGQDLRYALRMMLKSPGFTAAALLSLAFGIGTNSAIFSVVDALLLKELPVREAERLVVLGRIEDGEEVPSFSYPAYRRLADSAAPSARVMAVVRPFLAVVRPLGSPAPDRAGVRAGGDGGGGAADTVETASAQLTSGNLFEVLGVDAAVGRTFTAAEDTVPGGHPVAVLSHGYWQRRFGGDAAVVGRTLAVNGAAVQVVGVAAASFRGVYADAAPDLFLPITLREQVKYAYNSYADGESDDSKPVWNQVNLHWLQLLARRRPGVSLEQAGAVLSVIYERAKEAQLATHLDPESRQRIREAKLVLEPGARGLASLRDTMTRPLLLLTGVAGLVLLIACANVANLLLARADRRRKEMAVRLGIGAGRGRLLRQLLTESLLLAGLGGVLGLAAASLGGRLLLSLVSSDGVPLPLDIALDPRKLLFAAAVALATGVGFGLVPALQATRVDLSSSLKEGARAALSGSGGAPGAAGGAAAGWRRVLPLGRALVVAQIGLSLLLLIGAGLFVRSLQNLMSVDPGFARDRLLLVAVNPRLLEYDGAHLLALYDRLVERVEAIPGVRSASLALFRPMGTSRNETSVTVPDYPARPREQLLTRSDLVTPRYFQTLDVALLAGRGFAVRDRQGTPEVAVVNETFCHKYLPRRPLQAAVGERFGFDPEKPRQIEIVGVARDAKYNRLGEPTPAMVYLPVGQRPDILRDIQVRLAATGAAGDAAGVAHQVRRAIAEAEPRLAVLGMATGREQIDRSLGRERAIARLTGFFGLLALLLSAVGLYGVMSYSVSRRTNEIGLRMALGAPRGRVLGMILRETTWLIVIGLGAGLAGALATTRLAAAQLFGLSVYDPATLATATVTMALVALVAGLLPARRAAETNPMEALRYE
jgi:predicted permease